MFLPTQSYVFTWTSFCFLLLGLNRTSKVIFFFNLHGKMSLISMQLLLLTLICFWGLQNILLSAAEETSVEVIHSLLAGTSDKRQHRDSPKHFIAINVKQNITKNKGFFFSFFFLIRETWGKFCKPNRQENCDFNSSSLTWLDFVSQPADA